MRTRCLLLVILGSIVSVSAAWFQAHELKGVEKLRSEAEALQPLVKTKLAAKFLAATEHLPAIQPRTIFRDPATSQWLTSAQAETLPEDARAALQERAVDDTLYYFTKYGSPLAYVRVLELAGEQGIKTFRQTRILDFGYGTIGHLRMMASCGALAVGLDVDPFLTALYSEAGDTGLINGPDRSMGTVRLISGRLSEEKTKTELGGDFHLITSKNTLKRGYVHPPEEAKVDPRMLVDLGLEDAEFLRAIFDALQPGGYFIIYNLSPKQAAPDEKYLPWADGRCPFDRALFEQVGFEIVRFDEDDNGFARQMARALGWDQGTRPMDVENDLFALYTIVKRPGAARDISAPQ